MSVPVPTTPLLFEACHPGGRGSNSCDHGQGGVHCQREAEGAGGRVGEVGGLKVRNKGDVLEMVVEED